MEETSLFFILNFATWGLNFLLQLAAPLPSIWEMKTYRFWWHTVSKTAVKTRYKPKSLSLTPKILRLKPKLNLPALLWFCHRFFLFYKYPLLCFACIAYFAMNYLGNPRSSAYQWRWCWCPLSSAPPRRSAVWQSLHWHSASSPQTHLEKTKQQSCEF